MAVSLSVVIIGFTALAAQIIFVREALIVFYGNELSIGLILAGWLAGGAIGSFLLGRLVYKIRSRIPVFSLCQGLLLFLLPGSILAIRNVRPFLKIAPGEIIPFFPMAVSSLVALVPLCAVLGFMFSLACGMYEKQASSGAVRISRVYALEATGSVIGGFIAGFIFITAFSPMRIMAILGLLNAASAFILVLNKGVKRDALFPAAVSILIICAGMAMWYLNVWDALEDLSLRRQWGGLEVVSSRNSIYGNTVVTKKPGQTSFFYNGLHLYTIPDKMTSEEAVHFALLEHPRPKKVLLIGGGLGGLVEEILKHPVDEVSYVELDPMILSMAKDLLDPDYYKPLKDPKVSIKIMDGRLYVNTTQKRYDCVIINVGEPSTAQINRFYSEEFFKSLGHILNKGGVVSFSMPSSENYINSELRDLLRTLYTTLSGIFPDVLVIPGDTAFFIASDGNTPLTYDYRVLSQRIMARSINTEYVQSYYLFSRLSRQRISYIRNDVCKRIKGNVNHDFRPIACYYDVAYWSSRFKNSLFTFVLKNITRNRILGGFLFACVLFLIYGVMTARKNGSFERTAMVSIWASGFSSMSFQMLILLSFQILYGYLFYKLGAIMASFMAGMALCGWSATRMLPRINGYRRPLIIIQACLTVYPVILAIFFASFAHNILFPVFSALAGLIGGMQFSLANAACLIREKNVERLAGINYGTDLAGSCLGAVVTGAFLIPVAGVYETSFLIASMNFFIFLILLYDILIIE